MNKRKIIILIISVIVVMMSLIFFININKSDDINIDKESITQNKYYTETENSISFKSDESLTEIKEKIISINPFQKAEITIDKNRISGDLIIEVIEKESSKKLNKQIDLLTNNEIIKIEEGLGEYILKIDSKEISGTYSVKWNVEENNNTELYTSSKGYALMYDSSKFQIINENGKEKFKYTQDENDIYFMVEIIESENILELKNQMIESANATGNCKITEGNLDGVYTETINENFKKRNMIFDISENKMLIIETNEYDKFYEKFLIKEHIKNMIKTFRLGDVN